MIYALIAIITVVLDQLTKWLVSSGAELGETLFSVPYIFDCTYVQNTGAAFSILEGKMWFLSIISIVFCIGVIIFWIKEKPTHPLLCTAVTLMFAGALGNAIDRLFLGYVVDFISLNFMEFPVFNIADIGVTVGAAMIIVYTIFFDKNEVEK